MLDFVNISVSSEKKGVTIVAPEFLVGRSRDLMTRGHSFYAVWDEENNIWSQDMYRVQEIVDEELAKVGAETREMHDDKVVVKYLKNSSNKKWSEFLKHCKDSPDNYKELDSKVMFANSNVKKTDYVSRKLSYNIDEDGDISAYEELMNVLYEPEERQKFEWAIGSVFTGESRNIQKFLVFYGSAGTGKSTVLNIIEKLFEYYCVSFDSKALSTNKDFALEQFRSNPLVAIQHDGNLSKIEDNTKLNSLISHEKMQINEKFKSTYEMELKTMLFMGSNSPVMITDAKSGIIRRLIDVTPTGKTVAVSKYDELISQINFEIGAIAYHCIKVFKELGANYYNGYRSTPMIGATNEFYNFVEDNYDFFIREEFVTLSEAWRRYKLYCEDALVNYPMRKMIFKNELKNYFEYFEEHNRHGSNIYYGFIRHKFDSIPVDILDKDADNWLNLTKTESILDDICGDCPAQYSTKDGIPSQQWSKVETKLKDIDTSKEHYVRLPEDYIVIDFDYKDEKGNKDPVTNMEEARKWPKTYAEFSKSGGGIHLHYIYSGDVSQLANRINDDVEIKKFTGKSALRRKLSTCNDIPIAMLNSGLPIKKGDNKRMIDFKGFETEKALRNHIIKCMKKEHHGATKPEVDFIYSSLEQAYESGISYDLTTLRPSVLSFAMSSTNHAQYCLELVNKMKFASKENNISESEENKQIIFYDVEVFPNLFLVNWKIPGEDKKCVRMIQPSSDDIEKLVKKYNLIGFNCRRYDNHIMYARMMGYTNKELYDLSRKIISGSKNSFFMEAYNMSYTDVYDFASAGNKKSLKKWEIELNIHHQELGLPWDQPVPEELWPKVAEYCDNDVISTEVVFNHLKSDWVARQILSTMSGLSLNASTNQHTTKIIFGNDRKPQSQFLYRDLSKPVKELPKDVEEFLCERQPYMMKWWRENTDSLLPYFPGYKFDAGKSTYKGKEVGEGGFVYAEPSMESEVGLDDVASMHPNSALNECLFGVEYTKRYADIVDSRLAIKHEDWDSLRNDILDGKLSQFVDQVVSGEITAKQLAGGVKTPINAVYGLTKASFEHPFRDQRNKDNIVAKRGALFMIDLMEAVQEKGWKVLHIKTDSIKIPNMTPEKVEFVNEFGLRYGYNFELEETYDRICLVNNAVYIAKYKEPHKDKKTGNDIWWTATGAEFQHPYIFKKLFSHEEIEFNDLKETKEVRVGSLYLDMNENLPEGEHDYHFVGRIGAFVPIKEGCGGGDLLQIDGDNVSFATGSKGHKWLEAEAVQLLDKQNDIDYEYYDNLVRKAYNHINEFGDADKFINNDKQYFGYLSFLNVDDEDSIPYF